MTKLRTPWLIQRCALAGGKLRYDYMGSTEFEWGACPKSLKRIFEKGISTGTVSIPVDDKPVAVHMVAGNGFPFDDYQPHLRALAGREVRLQESSHFDRAVSAGTDFYESLGMGINVWFDIDNDVLWTLSESNQRELVAVLSGIKEAWASKNKKD